MGCDLTSIHPSLFSSLPNCSHLQRDIFEESLPEALLGSLYPPKELPGTLKGPLEEDMATHSSILAWRIPQTEEPGGLQSMGSQRVRHD